MITDRWWVADSLEHTENVRRMAVLFEQMRLVRYNVKGRRGVNIITP